MDGRRRRAQRLARNMEDQPQESRPCVGPDRTADSHPPEAEAGTRRRRNSPQENKQESKQEDRQSKTRLRVWDRLAGAGKKALQGLGGLLVLVVLLAREGAKKLGIKKERTPITAQSGQECEIEPAQPEDYRGRGHVHGQKAARMPDAGKKRRALRLNRALSALCICVALVSAWQAGSIMLRSIRTRQLNSELARQREAAMQPQESAAPAPLTVFMPEEAQPAGAPVQTDEPEIAAALAAPQQTPAPDVVRTAKYHQVGGDALPEMAALHAQNRDLVAWIQIPDVLDLPVVYRDNDYYLTRDFNQQKNASGTVFLDVNHPFKEKTQHLLLHGHNMKDGTMFGRLVQYLNDDTYIRNHPFISFDTLWKKEQYVIVAVLNVSLEPGDTRFFNYFTHDTFSSDAEFASYVRQLQLRSEYAIPIDIQPGDAMLTLSTCLENDRLVIAARRLREGESRSDLRALIRMTTRQ